MRRYSCFMFALLLACTHAYAGFQFPGIVWNHDKLEEAQAQARSKNKPLAFIYTRRSSSCGLNKAASLDAYEYLKGTSVIVYADCDKARKVLPKAVTEALSSPAAGKYIPKVVIVDCEMSKVISTIPYTRDRSARKRAFREAAKKIEEAMPKRSIFGGPPGGGKLSAQAPSGRLDKEVLRARELMEENRKAKELWAEGRKHMAKKDFDGAIKCYEQARDMSQKYSWPYYRLGLCYEAKGDKARALKNYKKYLELTEGESKREKIRQKVRGSIEELESSE